MSGRAPISELLSCRAVQLAYLGFVVAASIVILSTPLMARLARRTGVVDRPADERRMHPG